MPEGMALGEKVTFEGFTGMRCRFFVSLTLNPELVVLAARASRIRVLIRAAGGGDQCFAKCPFALILIGSPPNFADYLIGSPISSQSTRGDARRTRGFWL